MTFENTRILDPKDLYINGAALTPRSIRIEADNFYFDPDFFMPVPKDPIEVVGPNGYIDFKNGYRMSCGSKRDLKIVYEGNAVAEFELTDDGKYERQTSLPSDLQEVL